MNILMLLFKDVHYDARVKREALALAEEGHEVLIACVEEYHDTPPSFHEKIQIIRVQVSTKRIKRSMLSQQKSSSIKKAMFRFIRLPIIKFLKDILANREYMLAIKRGLKSSGFSPHVIHCHDLNTLPVGVLLNKGLKKKLVYDSHELFNEMASKHELEKRIGYIIESLLMKNVNHLITVNMFLKEEFVKRYGNIPSTIVQNIPIHHEFSLNNEENYFRKKYKLLKESRLLLYQGGLNPERGLESCIEAVRLLSGDYRLIFIGAGRIKEQLEDKVSSLGLEHRVFFHDQVPSEQLVWYTTQADIGLVMYENTCKNNYLSTPNKVFEYLQAGLPAVASNHPGKATVINQYHTGVTVEESPESIKNGILEIEAKYSKFKENCIEASRNLSWKQEKRKLTELYQKLGESS